MGISPEAESLSNFKKRVQLALNKIFLIAEKHNSIVQVGHGLFNYFLAKELAHQGWIKNKANKISVINQMYWNYLVFKKT